VSPEQILEVVPLKALTRDQAQRAIEEYRRLAGETALLRPRPLWRRNRSARYFAPRNDNAPSNVLRAAARISF
jgi:hypothetical protein